MAAMRTASGLAAFAEALASGHHQILTAEGDAARLRATLSTSTSTQATRTQRSAPSTTGRVRRTELQGLSVPECVEWELKDLVASILKVPRDQLLVDDNLAEYGFDSITLAEFAVGLGQRYGIDVPPTVLFGHPTLEKLAAYLLDEHGAALA